MAEGDNNKLSGWGEKTQSNAKDDTTISSGKEATTNLVAKATNQKKVEDSVLHNARQYKL